MKPLQIGDKLAKLPLIQGGMGVGVSLSRLAGAVARTGGIGIISTAQIGFREADFQKDTKAANLRAMVAELKKPATLLQMQTANARDLSDIISWLPRRIMRIT